MPSLTMLPLSLARAVPRGIPIPPLARPSAHHLRLALALLPTTRAAPISYSQTPDRPPPPNPTLKDRIPPQRRPLSRPQAPPPPAKTEEELAALPYVVRRTPYGQPPIYRRWLSGGNRVVVLVKKVDGDRSRLAGDLAEALALDAGMVTVNPTTQHIEIKTDQFNKAREWLLSQGF